MNKGSIYTPDCWEIVKITHPAHGTHYRVLASWYGGFAGANSWKLSSGIESASLNARKNGYVFPQWSGSTYVCYKEARRVSGLMGDIFATLQPPEDSEATVEYCHDDPLIIDYKPVDNPQGVKM